MSNRLAALTHRQTGEVNRANRGHLTEHTQTHIHSRARLIAKLDPVLTSAA